MRNKSEQIKSFPKPRYPCGQIFAQSCNRAKCLASLIPSRSNLLCSHGLHVNSFCLVLHMDMSIIRGIMLVAWVLQKKKKNPLIRKCLSQVDKGSMYKNNDYSSMICRNLRARLASTRVNRLRKKKFHNLPWTPAASQTSAVVNHLLPLSFPPSLDPKEAWILCFLRMVL